MSFHVNHHTSLYSWPYSVYRRGFPITLTCPCENSGKIASLMVGLRCGRTNYGRSTSEIKVSMGYETGGWTVSHEPSSRQGAVAIVLESPSNASIGAYTANVYVNGQHRQSTKFLLFFNPWCRDDQVYLEEDVKREEYVNNTHTVIYQGTAVHMGPRSWYLAQFRSECVEAALMMLDLMSAEDRASPVKVSRHLSALVNSNDDNGVLGGNWSGDYSGGTSPNAWSGSHQILAKYARYRSPVRYAQCWVYCGVLCTVLRTCGFPARCITTYNAFHDNDGSLAWEMYFNRHLRPVFYGRRETMWNFHCWNEAWMDRQDLPKGNGGWQIVDATPQERSEGRYKCGPASQAAVKEGHVECPFDTGFVFAEVNADKVFYYQKPGGGYRVGRVDSQIVGRNISTKAVGSNHREDVTHQYKYQDNSMVERIIQSRVAGRRHGRPAATTAQSQVQVSINAPPSVSFDSNCLVGLRLFNSSRSTAATVKLRVLCALVSYRGRVRSVLVNQLYETTLKPLDNKEFEETLTSSQIRQSVRNDHAFIKVSVIGLAGQEGFVHSEAVIEVDPPRISITEVPASLKVGQRYRLKVSVFNPFDTPMSNARLVICGEPIPRGKTKLVVGSLSPKNSFSDTFEVLSMRPGGFHVYATLNSNQVSGFERSLLLTFT